MLSNTVWSSNLEETQNIRTLRRTLDLNIRTLVMVVLRAALSLHPLWDQNKSEKKALTSDTSEVTLNVANFCLIALVQTLTFVEKYK